MRVNPARSVLTATVVALLGFVAAGCTSEPEHRPVTVAPGAPGEPGRVLTEPPMPAPGAPHTVDDVRFVQAMIAHHEQALRMTGLVQARTASDDVATFAARIELTQAAEITQLQDWLEQRSEPVGGDQDHGGHDPMPGMLTEDQFTALAAARGVAFDRRFLELMIYHHEGALIMVDQLRAAGGAQEAELFQLVTHIDADQRIEIGRMQRLLAAMTSG